MKDRSKKTLKVFKTNLFYCRKFDDRDEWYVGHCPTTRFVVILEDREQCVRFIKVCSILKGWDTDNLKLLDDTFRVFCSRLKFIISGRSLPEVAQPIFLNDLGGSDAKNKKKTEEKTQKKTRVIKKKKVAKIVKKKRRIFKRKRRDQELQE